MSARADELRALLPETIRTSAEVYEAQLFPGSILRDDTLQARKELKPAVIKRYALKYGQDDETNAMPPIWVWLNENDEYVLLEGWHRREAAEQAGLTQINAIVFHGIPRDAAAALAAHANMAHGVPLSNPERRKALSMGWEGRYKHLSIREIAAEIGTAHTNVARWIRQDELKHEEALEEPEEDFGGPMDYWAFQPVTKDGQLNPQKAGPYLERAGRLRWLLQNESTLGVSLARQLALKAALSANQRKELLALVQQLTEDLERVASDQLSPPPVMRET